MLTKEYSKLPPFDGTEPTSPRQANGDGGISNEMIPINDLSKLFCLTNALQLSRDDVNPFHPYGSMEETVKALISTATDDMGPTSRDPARLSPESTRRGCGPQGCGCQASCANASSFEGPFGDHTSE